jgi:hypothetical protein
MHLSGGLYELDFKATTGNKAMRTMEKANVAISAELAHRRFGHYNLRSVKEICKLDAGIASITGDINVCGVCKLSKQTRASFPVRGNDSKDALKPLEVVDADIFGPVETVSRGGAKYGLMFTDRHSRYRMIYFLGSRDEALNKFKAYVKDVSGLLNGAKIKRLHSDGAREFQSDEFKDYCKINGILQTESSPHTPEQNGIAERSIRTVQDMTRCICGKRLDWIRRCGLPRVIQQCIYSIDFLLLRLEDRLHTRDSLAGMRDLTTCESLAVPPMYSFTSMRERNLMIRLGKEF